MGLVTPVAAGIAFPTTGIAPGRETIVLIVHEATRTGAPILAWNLVRELSKTYNTVILLKRGGAIQPAFEATAAAVICLPDDFPMRTSEIDALASKISDVYAPIYAIANTVESRYLVPELETLGVPVVALVHEFSSTYRPVGVLHELFNSASNIVFPAQLVADAAVADYTLLEGRDFKILPQGQSRLPPTATGKQSERAPPEPDKIWPGSAADVFRVIGIGTVTKRKGVDLFIAVSAAAKRMLPDRKLTFAWVGTHYAFDQPYFDALIQQLDSSGLNASFEFLGELDDLDPVYDRANLLLLSSRLDPLPNVAIDSALRGLPVICFDQASGMAEILSKYDTTRGLVVPYLDTDAAARLICDLAVNPIQHDQFSLAIAEIARQRFDMKGYVDRIDRLGCHAALARKQIKLDQAIILQEDAFNPDLNLGHNSDSMNIADNVLKYLRDSRLAAPWTRPRAGLFLRRPLPGFNPLIYAAENPAFDRDGVVDPLAHFVRSGRPAGRWTHRVILPAVNSGSPVHAGKIAVHGHFHYPELLPEFIDRLNHNATTFDLFLTTTSQAKADDISATIAKSGLQRVEITVTGNRGRDLASFLQGLSEGRYSGYDVVGHFHGKRSPHVDKEIGRRWRDFMWEHLIGGHSAIADTILDAFAQDPKLGLVFAEDPHLNGWDENLELAESLAARMGLPWPLAMHFDFPIGTMFWARPQALQPLTRLNLHSEDFPAEPLPIDGTLLHALERLVPFATTAAGFNYATTYVKSSKR